MPLFTCITCRVAFADGEIQRRHYKTDWHRYNLKRKVAEMAPVTAEVFEQKVLAQKAEQEAQQKSKTKTMHCQLCGKTFSSENAHNNHLSSKKHREMEAVKVKKDKSCSTSKPEEKSKPIHQRNVEPKSALSSSNDRNNDEDFDDEEDDDDIMEGVPLDVEDCLFCSHHSASMEENMQHMTRYHSFFVPDLEFVVDLKGFLEYLGEKVGIGNMCLYCNQRGKTFYSVEAAQAHMMDKGHTKIDYDGDAVLEYADFYDFSSSYPDYDPDGEDNENGEVQTRDNALTVDEETLELCLPSGAKVGHRSLHYIYKQSLPPERNRHSKVIRGIMADYKALGWHGTIGTATRQKVKDIRVRNEKLAKRRVDVSVKANKLQKHFRPQVVF